MTVVHRVTAIYRAVIYRFDCSLRVHRYIHMCLQVDESWFSIRFKMYWGKISAQPLHSLCINVWVSMTVSLAAYPVSFRLVPVIT